MQASHELVELREASGDANNAPIPLEGVGCLIDSGEESVLERPEAALGPAGGGEIEEPLLRGLDLIYGIVLEVMGEGLVDHVLAERDQLAPQVEIVDGAAVILGIDDRDHRAGEPCKVLAAADLL